MGKRTIASKVIAIVLCTAALASFAACSATSNSSGGSGSTTANAVPVGTDGNYADKLFDKSYVHTIDITISDEDWADLKANPTDKTKYNVNLTIDGETIEQVAFATKGNTSLSSVASDADSDRYSFKVNFGKYVDGQTYYGLDKLNLNNLYADSTYMKDYLSYTLFSESGVDSPLVSYVWVTVNGEDFGLYLAIEGVDSSYLDRTNDGDGELYKPETEMLGNMDQAGGPGGQGGEQGGQGGPGGQMPEGMQFPGGDSSNSGASPQSGSAQAPSGDFQMPSNGAQPPSGDFQMPSDGSQAPSDASADANTGGAPTGDMQFPGGGFNMGGNANGADLVYTDDELSSYSDIFDNAETNVTEEDEQRVVAALKALSEGNVDQAVDTSEVISYFAAHNFVLNYDSYTGMMLHNYYLLEDDGKLSMLPWDYNLAFGGFGGASFGGSSDSGATSLVNMGIDSPLSSASESARPMWAWIVENDQYKNQYHEALDKLISGYFESGDFEKEIDALYETLLPYVEKDPSAFYSADEFTEGYKTLKQFCLLRAQSIRAQLNGSLATTTSEQSADAQVDASAISVDAMGSQGGGRDGGNGGPGQGGFPGGAPGNGGDSQQGFPGGESGSGFDPRSQGESSSGSSNPKS